MTLQIEHVAFDFIDDVKRLRDPSAILDRLRITSASLGYPYFILTGLPLPNQRLEPFVMLNAWPEAWYERYTAEEHFHHDRVGQAAMRTTEPYRWSDLAIGAEDRSALRVMDEAQSCGLVDGFIVPMFSSDSWQQACAFATDRPAQSSDRELAALHVMSVFAAGAARAAFQPLRDLPELTTRERECLHWAAAGKSAWETSQILGIGLETVRTYRRTLRTKLDVATMAQAVAEGCRLGIIAS
ncbi:LuxR family transcriptional regulator [Antarcticirhabdus aurantiaca]|uniref:LuxR family transcriptional regulator n=1 Tax=Antarcticirhabdus aurantiaca TaxID=2606717 RepID=A0ACD4NJ48_9HYPH|nr:LuxR family transcriptional regulator [Antarcticirhabdus aurantiaca]WAJ26812.1 LuxR family transcriptional regulator [Jeongeuplla avenae]